MKESLTQQQYTIQTFSDIQKTEKIDTARQKTKGERGGGGNNDDQNAELKQGDPNKKAGTSLPAIMSVSTHNSLRFGFTSAR